MRRSRSNSKEIKSQVEHRDRSLASTIRELYPNVKEIVFDFTLDSYDARALSSGRFKPDKKIHRFLPSGKAWFEFPCLFSECDGRFKLREEIQNMVARHLVESSGTKHCGGTQHIPTRGTGLSCDAWLDYKITITFHDAG